MAFRRTSHTGPDHYAGQHRHEHWYRDNTVYFLTARVRGRAPAFASDAAKAIFWDRFNHYAKAFGYVPWVTSLLDNHWHSEGYLREGRNLGPFMQRLHGSVAKLVNDLLPARIEPPFFGDAGHKSYFDGCLRDPKQGRLTYRYTYTQCVRHGICADPRDYPHTRVNVEMERAIRRAVELDAFMTGVRYKRYDG
jgi:hypothetical protein